MHLAIGESGVRCTNKNSTLRPPCLPSLPFLSFFFPFYLTPPSRHNKTIGGNQMSNIKTITLMDFDWDDFIGVMKVNIHACAVRSPNYDFQRLVSLSCTFGHLFKLNSLATAITKGDISLAEKFVRNNR